MIDDIHLVPSPDSEATPGQRDYEEELKRNPFYSDGEPRLEWGKLPVRAKTNWENKVRHKIKAVSGAGL